MKRFLISGLLIVSSLSNAAACCGVEGLRSYFSLQELQNYDLAVSSTFQEVVGWHDDEGRIQKKTGPSFLIFQLSSLVRLDPNLETFGRFPLFFQTEERRPFDSGSIQLGDLQVGARLTLHRSLFVEETIPTISVVMGAKLPTGGYRPTNFPFLNNLVGNGFWEPFLGLSFRKEYYDWLGSLDASFSHLTGNVSGQSWSTNQVNLTESVSYALHRRLNVGLGGQQTWILSAENTRALSVFASANYFISRFTTLGLQSDWSLPIDGFSVNQPAARSLGLLVRVGFY